jgi:DnaJ-class molecular chaperone
MAPETKTKTEGERSEGERRGSRRGGDRGLIRCENCNGTGTAVVRQLRSEHLPETMAVEQHITCPQCEGLGEYYAAAQPSVEARLEGTIGYPTKEATTSEPGTTPADKPFELADEKAMKDARKARPDLPDQPD